MARRLDHVVVVDVESTCWEGSPPPGQTSEIIEVGVCTFDVASATPLERESILVRPERSKVSEFCTALTTLTQEQVDAGVSFAEACSILKRDHLTRERPWASWGDYDRRQFERQCDATGVPFPFGPTHLNLKTLFAVAHALHREVGMEAALQRLGMPLEGAHHRGADDAWNIARLLATLLPSREAARSR
jgi:inhibitor of KinA sporulation pathway (predicted exonuclease)